MEVALRVHEPDPNERNAEVAGLLAVIAREDTEAARVDWQGLMEGELGGEIRQRAGSVRKLGGPPGLAAGAQGVERGNRIVVQLQEFGVGRRCFHQLGRDEAEHQHRVVGRLPPQRVVEPPKHAPRRAVPRPPQIVCQFRKPPNPFGDRCLVWSHRNLSKGTEPWPRI